MRSVAPSKVAATHHDRALVLPTSAGEVDPDVQLPLHLIEPVDDRLVPLEHTPELLIRDEAHALTRRELAEDLDLVARVVLEHQRSRASR
jgi:hypothetical protein